MTDVSASFPAAHFSIEHECPAFPHPGVTPTVSDLEATTAVERLRHGVDFFVLQLELLLKIYSSLIVIDQTIEVKRDDRGTWSRIHRAEHYVNNGRYSCSARVLAEACQ